MPDSAIQRLIALSRPNLAAALRGIPAISGMENTQGVTVYPFEADAVHRAFRASKHNAIAAERRRRIEKRALHPFRASKDPNAYWKLRLKLTAARLTQGFVFGPGTGKRLPKGVRFATSFIEQGFRSDCGSVSYERFPSLFPHPRPPRKTKAGVIIPGRAIMVGDDKGAVRPEYIQWRAFDCRYITQDSRRLAFIIADLDHTFESEDDCLAQLKSLLGQELMPTFVVGTVTPDLKFERPHCIWMLENPVWNDHSHKNCKPGPIRLFHAVHRAIINKLLPLGADIGQLANPWKMKNPLSPWWSSCCPNETWHSLETMISKLKRVSRGHLIKQRATGGDSRSCSDWGRIKGWCSEALVTGHQDRSPDYMAAVNHSAKLITWQIGEVTKLAIAAWGVIDDQQREMIGTQCGFSAPRWSPTSPYSDDVVRGRDAAEIEHRAEMTGIKPDKRECQQIAQEVTARDLRAASIEFVSQMIATIVPAGQDPYHWRPVVVARCKGNVGKSTVYEVFEDAVIYADSKFRLGVSRYIETETAKSLDPVGSENVATCRSVNHTSADQNIGPSGIISVPDLTEKLNVYRFKPIATKEGSIGSSPIYAEGLRSVLPLRSKARRYTEPPTTSRSSPTNVDRRVHRTFTGQREKAVDPDSGKDSINQESRWVTSLFSSRNDEALELIDRRFEETDLTSAPPDLQSCLSALLR